jgi:replicative DNA helicase
MNTDLELSPVPWSNEAEQSVLGGLLLDNRAWDRVGDMLTPRHFFSFAHGLIFGAIGELINATKPADVITVFERLQRRRSKSTEEIEELLHLPYLNALAQSVPSAANVRRYAEIVRERHSERVLRETADIALTIAMGGGEPAVKLNAIVARFAALERQQVQSMPVGLSSIIVQRLDHLNDLHDRGDEALAAWSTGFDGLDEILMGGLQRGRIYLLAGRPSMGKSALAQWWALLAAVHDGAIVLYLSLEMPKAEVGDRTIAMVGKVSYEHVQTGKLTDGEWSAVSQAVETCGRLDFDVDDQAGLTSADIRIKARSVQGLQILVIDHVQLCKGAEEGDINRNTELEIISRGLKELAKELDCAVLVLTQLARRVEEKPNKRAGMSDMKDSGGLEQDADVIMSLFPIGERTGHTLIGLDVLKHKQGKRNASLALEFHGHRLGWVESKYLVADLLAKPKESRRGAEV